MEHEQQTSPNDEITAELWDEVTADTADTPTEFAAADEQTEGTGSAPAAEAPAPAPAEPEPKQEAAPDPYAGLPEPVRNALTAHQAAFEQRVRSAEGRVAALQRELAQRSAAPAPAAEAPPKTKLDALREELPEVVAAIEEARGQAVDPDALRKQIRAETMAELQEDMLNDARPTWANDVISPDFKAWLASQPADFASKVNNTDKASVLIGALSKFDAAKAAIGQRQAIEQGRSRRVAAAVTPTGVRRTPAKALDDLSEDEFWAEVTKDS